MVESSDVAMTDASTKSCIDSAPSRRSSRRRGHDTHEPILSVSVVDIADIMLPSSPAPTTEQSASNRRRLRSSKPLADMDKPQPSKSEEVKPRRYTRSTASTVTHTQIGTSVPQSGEIPHSGQILRSEESADSGGSTPVQDEPARAEEIIENIPDNGNLAVLSDLCAAQERLPTPTNDEIQETTPALVQSDLNQNIQCIQLAEGEPPHPTNPLLANETADNQTIANENVDSQISANETTDDNILANGNESSALVSDSYEPELHFEEMSRNVLDHNSPSSPAATPTLDEPASPDRLTESPSSPTPESPTEPDDAIIHRSASMVTIPLEGGDALLYQHSDTNIPGEGVTPTPPTIPIIPTGRFTHPFSIIPGSLGFTWPVFTSFVF